MRSTAFAVCLLTAAQAWALTLGPARGAALIGRPLDLVVPVSLDAGSDPNALCLEPEVFYGDTRASAGRVSARVETGPQASIRVRSEAPVDEPVVTVYLRVGCDQKVTRRFVLFAEPPADAVTLPAPVAAAVPAPAARAAAAAPTPVPAAVAANATGTAPAASARKAPRPRGEPKKAAVREPAAPRPRARLKLEPLNLGIEHDARLKSTLSIDTVPEASAQRRAEALALWQALTAQPEDVLRNSQRLQALEGDVKSLRDAVMKDRANLAEVRGELGKAREERYANFLVYGLAIALLLAAALAAWAWRRSPREARPPGRDWWRKPAAAAATDFGAGPSTQGVTDGAAPITAPVPPARPKEPDLGFSESMLESVQAQTAAVRAVAPRVPFKVSGRGEFADSFGTQAGGMRAVKAEELHDLQQQADFFVSLGEYDRAIEVLRSHIYVNPETSALAWLDLLDIYHRLQRKDDYEWVRGEFNRVFNAQAPAFDRYHEDDGGLESYQQALSRIVALWPSPRVLDVIEESIFRKPGRDGSEAFSLEAYRELLMLHSLGKDIIEAGDAPVDFVTSSQPTGFSPTSLEALSARLMTPSASMSRIGLDINLDEPPPPSSDLMEVGAADATSPPGNLIDFDLPDIGSTDSEPPATRR